MRCSSRTRRSSCKPFLARIEVPTLVINALNDPFVPRRALAARDEVSDAVTLEYHAQGGHVGFLSGGVPGRSDWLPMRLLDFFDQRLAESGGAPGPAPAR